jgi:hypothetical protein
MASSLYDWGRQKFLEGSLSWSSNDIRAVLVKNDYTVDIAAHQNLSDIPSGSRIATSSALSSKTTTAGVADAADVTLSSVPAGSTCNAVVLYYNSGSAATSTLIAYIDTATGLPVTPNGSDVVIQWDNGGNKVFRL